MIVAKPKKPIVNVEKVTRDLSKDDAIAYIQGTKAVAPPKVMEPISD